jgi:protein MAK11
MATTNLPVRPSKRVRLDALRKGRSNMKISRSSYPELHKTLTSTPPLTKGKDKETDITPASNHKKTTNSMRVKPAALPISFKVVAGSYEKLLYGLDGCVSIDDEMRLQFHLQPTFIFPAHVSCIKAVSASPNGGKWLATGSSDEIIKVWDLRRRKEIGGLMHHEGFFAL